MPGTSPPGAGTAGSLPLPSRPLGVSRRRSGDRVFDWVVRCAVWLVIALAAALAMSLAWKSWPAMQSFGWRFLVTSTWDPVAGSFGALPFIYGTLVSSAVPLLIAVPLSIGAAVYLAELGAFLVP